MLVQRRTFFSKRQRKFPFCATASRLRPFKTQQLGSGLWSSSPSGDLETQLLHRTDLSQPWESTTFFVLNFSYFKAVTNQPLETRFFPGSIKSGALCFITPYTASKMFRSWVLKAMGRRAEPSKAIQEGRGEGP